MKRLACLLAALSLFLSSCALYDGAASLLGFDRKNYAKQEISYYIDLNGNDDDDEDEKKLLKCLVDEAEYLLYGDSVTCFDGKSSPSGDYRDALLDGMASKYYTKYSADGEMFSSLAENYPGLNVSIMIPAEDYENTVYRIFGGYEKVVHSSTSRYTYLEKINAYLLIGKQTEKTVNVRPLSVGVTNDTYRMTAEFYRNDAFLGEYTVVFLKRDDKEPYIRSLTQAENRSAS